MSSNDVTPLPVPSTFETQAASLIPAHVRMIAACHAEETAADVANASAVAQLPNPAGRAGGACTSALLEFLYESHKRETEDNAKVISFQQVLLELRKRLVNQTPQLTSSRPLTVAETPFSLNEGTGTCRAVLVGCNYPGQSGELRGCHADILNAKRYLTEVQGYLPENIIVLMDDGGRNHFPTRRAIILALQQLVAQSQPGDSAYFHFSGHGGLLSPDWNRWKQRLKAYDETIYPVDHSSSGCIRDFSLFKHFVQPMPAGVTVTCVMDCCHSGAVLDLPYSYKATSATNIRATRAMDSLSNLALLYVLAGGHLPMGFGNVTNQIEEATGQTMADLQGQGMDDGDIGGDYGDGGYGDVGGDYGDGGDFAGGDYAGNGEELAGAAYGSGARDIDGIGDATDGASPEFANSGCDVGEAQCDDADCSCGEGLLDVLGSLADM